MRDYQPSDYDSILEWCFIRDFDTPPKWSLPATGVIVPGIAVGFLVLTNNRMAWLEFYISNPLAAKSDRDKALDEITVELIEMAKDMHVKVLMCNSQHTGIMARAIKHGFSSLGNYASFSKGL